MKTNEDSPLEAKLEEKPEETIKNPFLTRIASKTWNAAKKTAIVLTPIYGDIYFWKNNFQPNMKDGWKSKAENVGIFTYWMIIKYPGLYAIAGMYLDRVF